LFSRSFWLWTVFPPSKVPQSLIAGWVFFVFFAIKCWGLFFLVLSAQAGLSGPFFYIFGFGEGLLSCPQLKFLFRRFSPSPLLHVCFQKPWTVKNFAAFIHLFQFYYLYPGPWAFFPGFVQSLVFPFFFIHPFFPVPQGPVFCPSDAFLASPKWMLFRVLFIEPLVHFFPHPFFNDLSAGQLPPNGLFSKLFLNVSHSGL